MHRKNRSGFSLVELVIVIVILGIIAAIAIPRVSRGSKGAGESALSSNLAVLRNAIELYASEHGGDYPGAKTDGVNAAETEASFASQLTKFSDADGKVNDLKDADLGFIYGPYLRKGIPPAPVGINKGSTEVAFDTSASPPPVKAGTAGWVYNYETGDIIVNSDILNEDGKTPYNKY